ncbi:MAG: hypothetical protein ILM98_01715 [Kiritimatiellae bacterium]|nr:hypothetical protein [Kiritimatiellia bacterium]
MNFFWEKLLELCGGEIWPPTHNDPRVKGPQPHILTGRQREALEKMREENGGDADAASHDAHPPAGGNRTAP